MRTFIRIVPVGIILLAPCFQVTEGNSTEQGSSVAIISSVSGETHIATPHSTSLIGNKLDLPPSPAGGGGLSFMASTC